MSEQRWFASVPVAGERTLEGAELDRLDEVAHDVWVETLGGVAMVVIALAVLITTIVTNAITSQFGFLGATVPLAMLRLVSQRRFFSPRVLLGVRRDRRAARVIVCRNDAIALEVLGESRIIWTKDGKPLERTMVAHETTTALVPEHAAMAANFVQPVDNDGQLFMHQRRLTAEELAELDSYAPRPNVALLALTAVGIVGALLTFSLALRGRSTTLLLPVVFAAVAVVAGRTVYRAWRARRFLATDLALGYVVIIRGKVDGELTPAHEVLPRSRLIWTVAGQPNDWRKTMQRQR